MNVSPDVNYEDLSRSTDDFNGAQCKAVCVEAVSLIHLFLKIWNVRNSCKLSVSDLKKSNLLKQAFHYLQESRTTTALQ
jgi:ATP-dependent 26S proteasome regulatory subunit